MVGYVADDFNIAGVFIPGRKLPLLGPVAAVIHLQKGRHFDLRTLVCLSMHACVGGCVCVYVPLHWLLQMLDWLSPQTDHRQHIPVE